MKKFFALLITMALSAAALLPVLVHGRNQLQGQSGKPEIQQAVHHDVSPPLRDIPSAPRSTEKKIEKRLLLPTAASQNQHDPVVQGNVAPLVGTTPGLNFAGVGNGDYGFTPNVRFLTRSPGQSYPVFRRLETRSGPALAAAAKRTTTAIQLFSMTRRTTAGY